MRRLALALALLALPGAAASELYHVVLDWQEGRALAPTGPYVTPPTADAFRFTIDPCHPHLVVDLLYEPAEGEAAVPGVGAVAVSYEFRVEVWRDGERELEKRVARSGYGIGLGTLEAGEHEVRLSLGFGADVAWEMRLRARFAENDPVCNPPPL